MAVTVKALKSESGLLTLGLVGAGFVAIVASASYLHHAFGGFVFWGICALSVVLAIWAAHASETLDERAALMVILATALGLRLALIPVWPYLSTDVFRYIWDGRVAAAGINPYRYIPSDPALAHLRDPVIYAWINRADYAPTIYPPAAQMFFLVATRFGESVTAMKVSMLVAEALGVAALLAIMARLEVRATRIALYVWHPLPVWEIAGNAHIDAVMTALTLGALWLGLSGRGLWSAAVLTLAGLAKPISLAGLPALWRPWNLLVPLVVVATAALAYAPYLSVGTKVLGFLPSYLGEEELTHGDGFRLIWLLEALTGPLPAWAVPVYATACAIILMALAVWVAFRADRSGAAMIKGYAVLVTVFLVLLTPHYPWYYVVLTPFLALYPWSLTLWALTAGGLQIYQVFPGDDIPDYHVRQLMFQSIVLAAVFRDVIHARRHALLFA